MTDSVAQGWARFAGALPKLGLDVPGLAAGATPEALIAFEAATGLALPDAVRAFFAGHSGQTSAKAGIAGGFYFVSLVETQKLLADWAKTRAALGDGAKDLDRACSSNPPKAIQRKYSLAGWVALLRDGEGNAIGADLEPGPAGTVGQIINFGRDEEDKHVLFPSAAELLEWLATELEAGRIAYDPEEKVVRHAKGRVAGVMRG